MLWMLQSIEKHFTVNCDLFFPRNLSEYKYKYFIEITGNRKSVVKPFYCTI